MPKANIAVNVTAFQPISGGNSTISPLVVDPPSTKVTVYGTKGENLSVGKGLIQLIFTIHPTSQYIPVGVTFQSTEDPNGLNNFGETSIDGSTITITDKYTVGKPAGGGKAPFWKFSLLIQEISSQKLGIVDPGIENSEEAVKDRPKSQRRKAGKPASSSKSAKRTPGKRARRPARRK